MVRDVPRQRDVKKRHCLSRVLLHCGYFEKAGNSLPLSEVADSPILGRELGPIAGFPLINALGENLPSPL